METMHSSPFPSPFPRLFHTPVPPQIEQPQRLGFWFHHKVCRFFFSLNEHFPNTWKTWNLGLPALVKEFMDFLFPRKKNPLSPFSLAWKTSNLELHFPSFLLSEVRNQKGAKKMKLESRKITWHRGRLPDSQSSYPLTFSTEKSNKQQ